MNQRNGTAWIEEVHIDPVTNIATAFEIGLNVPDIKHFGQIPIEEEKEIRDSWDWITIDHLGFAIKCIKGVPLTISAYWTGNSFILKTIFFNDKGLHCNGKGPHIDANCVTVFRNRSELCIKELKKFGSLIEEKSNEFEGYINIDVVYSDGRLWYQGIRVGLYFDYLFALALLYNKSPQDLLNKIEEDFEPAVNFAATLRLYDYYFSIEKTLELLDPHALSAYIRRFDEGAVAVGSGENIKKAWSQLYINIPQGIKDDPEICYRNDGDEFSRSCFYQLRNDGLL